MAGSRRISFRFAFYFFRNRHVRKPADPRSSLFAKRRKHRGGHSMVKVPLETFRGEQVRPERNVLLVFQDYT